MTDKQIIHGEQVPLITLTRQQLEEDWFTLWELYKAKEQECERLKEQLAEMLSQSALLPKFFGLTADEITNMLKQLDQLKAENKHLNDLLNQALKELEKTRETLTEIKEIAEFYNNSNMDNICYQDGIYEILQKISEVEE